MSEQPTPNKTRDFLKSFKPDHPGNQAFWGEALTNIPHPTKKGEVMNYNQFKQYLHSPEMIARPEYNDESKRNAYGEQVFKSAQQDFYHKADSDPNNYAFPNSAVEALNKPIEDFKKKHGDYIQSNRAYTPEINAQRLSDLKSNNSMATYKKGTKEIKVKDVSKRVLKSKLPKAANGLTDVSVPEAGNVGNILSSGLSTASTGASIAGPWGAAGGAILGIGEGLLQKSREDKLHNSALRINNDNRMNRAYDGVESTINQKNQVYKKGTKSLKGKKSKLIEAEHQEHIFDKNLNHKGVVTGNTHEEGGEVVAVNEGDSIFPAKHKATIDKHLKTGNKAAIKKIRNTLPKDAPKDGKHSDGSPWVPIDQNSYNKRDTSLRPKYLLNKPLYADNLNRVGQYTSDKHKSAVEGLSTGSSTYLESGQKGNPYPYSVIKNQEGTMWKHIMETPQLNPITGGIPTNAPAPMDLSEVKPLETSSLADLNSKAQNDVAPTTSPINTGNVLKYANIANNTIRGFQKPPTIEENYLNPELLKYTDRSESLRRDSRSAESIQDSNARNLSGGSIGNIRSNQAAANTANLERQDSINEREMGRADAVDNTNVDIKNKAKEVNLGRKDMYTDARLKQRAVSEQYQNAAIKEVADQAQVNERDNYSRMRDQKEDQKDLDTLTYLNQTSPKYSIDDKTKTINFDNKYGSSTNTNTKSSTTKTVDKNGKESTKSTTTTLPDKSTNISIFGKKLKSSRRLTK